MKSIIGHFRNDYDVLGNWTGPTYTKQNQPTTSGGETVTYDANGNLVENDDAWVSYTYDAWNRQVKVGQPYGGSTIATYGYDALGRRTESGDGTDSASLYYSSQGQVIEGRNSSGDTTAVYYWSPAYVDGLVERVRDSNGDGSLDEHLFAVQDANWNTTALVNTSGIVKERYLYDPYGAVTYLNADWTTKSTQASAYDSVYLFQGKRLDANTGEIDFDSRIYNPATGTFDQQDADGYINGPNLYQMEGSNPINRVDPMGTASTSLPTPPPWPTWSPGVIAPPEHPNTHNALLGALNKQQQKCPTCTKEAQALANAIDAALASQPWQVGGYPGDIISGATGVVTHPLHPITGAQTGGWGNQCGDWQALIDRAITPVLNQYGKDSCFSADNVNASTKGHLWGNWYHNWVEISGGGGTVVIDPYPSGGSRAVDSSGTGGYTSTPKTPVGGWTVPPGGSNPCDHCGGNGGGGGPNGGRGGGSGPNGGGGSPGKGPFGGGGPIGSGGGPVIAEG